MEKQSHAQQKPLETIKNIQSSLQALKIKIQYLQKQQLRTASNIEKIFTSSVPIIKNKIIQSNHINHKQKNKNSFDQFVRTRGEKINASRMKHQNQITKNKQLLADSKAFQCNHVKQISKQNQQKILSLKQSFSKQNKLKTQQIRQEKLQSKQKIEEFHLIKKHEIRKSRQAQSLELSKRIQKANASMQELLRKQDEIEFKKEKNTEILSKVQRMINYLYRVKADKFSKVVEKFGLNEETKFSDNLIEKILYEIEVLREEDEEKKIPQGTKEDHLSESGLSKQQNIIWKPRKSTDTMNMMSNSGVKGIYSIRG